MPEYPYTTVPGKIESLLKQIQETGVPTSTSGAWLREIGFTNSNDPSLLKVMKFIGIIDNSGAPTERWRNYRSRSESRRVLAQGVQEGYSSLFNTYSNAHERTERELTDFFTERSDAGRQAVSKTVATFRNLCALSDFGNTLAESEKEQLTQEGEGTNVDVPSEIAAKANGANLVPSDFGGGVTINLNIQLTLPAEMDRAGYGQFFAALRKHLMEPYKDSDDK